MRVLVADDIAGVRSAIRLMLETVPGSRIVAEATDARDLGEALRHHRPDCLILDWELPGTQALGGAARLLGLLREANLDTQLIVLSVDPESRRQAIDAGADAFVSKADPPERLLQALSDLADNPAQARDRYRRFG